MMVAGNLMMMMMMMKNDDDGDDHDDLSCRCEISFKTIFWRPPLPEPLDTIISDIVTMLLPLGAIRKYKNE